MEHILHPTKGLSIAYIFLQFLFECRAQFAFSSASGATATASAGGITVTANAPLLGFGAAGILNPLPVPGFQRPHGVVVNTGGNFGIYPPKRHPNQRPNQQQQHYQQGRPIHNVNNNNNNNKNNHNPNRPIRPQNHHPNNKPSHTNNQNHNFRPAYSNQHNNNHLHNNNNQQNHFQHNNIQQHAHQNVVRRPQSAVNPTHIHQPNQNQQIYGPINTVNLHSTLPKTTPKMNTFTQATTPYFNEQPLLQTTTSPQPDHSNHSYPSSPIFSSTEATPMSTTPTTTTTTTHISNIFPQTQPLGPIFQPLPPTSGTHQKQYPIIYPDSSLYIHRSEPETPSSSSPDPTLLIDPRR